MRSPYGRLGLVGNSRWEDEPWGRTDQVLSPRDRGEGPLASIPRLGRERWAVRALYLGSSGLLVVAALSDAHELPLIAFGAIGLLNLIFYSLFRGSSRAFAAMQLEALGVSRTSLRVEAMQAAPLLMWGSLGAAVVHPSLILPVVLLAFVVWVPLAWFIPGRLARHTMAVNIALLGPIALASNTRLAQLTAYYKTTAPIVLLVGVGILVCVFLNQ